MVNPVTYRHARVQPVAAAGRPADTARLHPGTRAGRPVRGPGPRIGAGRGRGRRRLLRIVVDADGGPGLDDIAILSRSLSAELDDSGVMGETAYTLEVSSPGVDRPLTAGSVTGAAPRAGWCASRWPPGRRGTRTPLRAGSSTAGPDGVVLDIAGQRREFGYQELGPGQVQVEFGSGGAAHDDEPGGRGGARWTLT